MLGPLLLCLCHRLALGKLMEMRTPRTSQHDEAPNERRRKTPHNEGRCHNSGLYAR
jgi:hypothetical protein